MLFYITNTYEAAMIFVKGASIVHGGPDSVRYQSDHFAQVFSEEGPATGAKSPFAAG
jgi:hypothetical protein